jgi:transaldolase
MKSNPLKKLESLGQSIWLDYIKRDLMSSGKLKQFIEEDGLKGMTSNPSIFENAIAKSNDYDQAIQKMKSAGKTVDSIYEALTEQDVGDAADVFLSVYQETKGIDGYVSLEVNPNLAHDTEGTIIEARRLWKALNRPNVMIKVPATNEGLPAIQQLISEGININITLLFGLPHYKAVAEAYLAGLEARIAGGKSINNIHSVASFFLSRIDVLIDPLLEKMIEQNNQNSNQDKLIMAKKVHGQVAIASAKAAYQIYKEIIISARFKKLVAQGAQKQRLLWASTSTKNPAYNDVKYVEALIGPDTVNTVPMETLEAYRDHGDPHLLLEQDLDSVNQIFQILPELGISIDQVTEQLLSEGVEKFNKAFDQLMAALKNKL